jgi:hypothetical protein
MLWNLLSFGQCIVEEMTHQAQDTLTVTHQVCHEQESSSESGNHQKHVHFCHSGHTSITLKPGYEITPIALLSSKQLFCADLNFKIKDVFLDGPFQPPRHPSFS